MTTTTTPRVGLTQQTNSAVDSPSMAMFNANMLAIENKLLIGITGVIGSRPTAGTRDRIYHASDTHVTYYDDGTSWRNVAATPTDATAVNTAIGTIPFKANGISGTTVDLLEVLLNNVVRFAVTSGNGVVVNPTGTNYLAKLAATTDHYSGYFLCNDALTAARSALVDVGTSFTGTYGLEARKGATSLFGVKPNGDTDVHGSLLVDNNLTVDQVNASQAIHTDTDLSVTGNATVTGNLAMTGTITGTAAPIVPVGGVIMWAGGSLPAGGKWKWCDGASIDQSAFTALFAAIGTSFNAGASGLVGPSQFAVPNLMDRFPQGTKTTMGAISGADHHTHQLSNNGHALITDDTTHQYEQASATSSPWTPDYQTNITRVAYAGGPANRPVAAANLDGATDDHTVIPPNQMIGFIIRALP